MATDDDRLRRKEKLNADPTLIEAIAPLVEEVAPEHSQTEPVQPWRLVRQTKGE